MKEKVMNWKGQMNGEWMELEVNPARRLLEMIRDDFEMTGTKISCEMGRCGACMVLLDGEPVNSCMVMAYQCHERSITTIEGLAAQSAEGIHPVQEAFIEEGGFQCGYCTPGMIISAKALLDQHPEPTIEDIKEGLCGNICRCTGYGSIMNAVQLASEKCKTKFSI